MTTLQLMPPEIAQQSILDKEIVVPLDAAIAAIDYCTANQIQILGWEGWVRSVDGRIGHGSAPQGTTSLEQLTLLDAADFCSRTIRAATLQWSENHPGTSDKLHFCITIRAMGIAAKL
ncbi:hypothetical protein [Burkholderia pyrrocinia]|uniref:hypothetical protein n=1 Tax=Burkholderia pyrrocinia TaxID=60550 RepID=UPI00158CB7D0|nr:hypothetical protein [Burkholderia pyrrocinia]